MPYRHPPEFRRKVLGLIAGDLGVSDQTTYTRRKQELIDTGRAPGLTATENGAASSSDRYAPKAREHLAH